MHKKRVISIGIIILFAATLFVFTACQQEEHWTHRTFQGTVTAIWTEDEQQFFTVRCSIGKDQYNEYSFVAGDDALSGISLEIGDAVVVESDYNMNEHNGTTVPYPAALIADATITD